MKFFSSEKIRKPEYRLLISLLVGLGIIVIFLVFASFITALTGQYSISSPFSCGTNCHGGYELFGHDIDYCNTNPGECFNTIDDCTDGNIPQYEFVENITITDLNRSSFLGGDTISIDAYLDCDSDSDQVVFAYNNESGFRSIYNTICSVNGKTHIYYNFTIDKRGGNHTIRVIIAYKGTSPEFGDILCGDEAPQAKWSDTDDMTFYVESAPDDEAPQVTAISPEPGTVYEKQEDLEVMICANVVDNYELNSVLANVSWENGSQELTPYETEENIYCEGFSDTTTLGRYNVSFFANDSSGNINDSATTYFIIEQTTNIILNEPTQGDLFAYGPIPLNFTIGAGYNPDAVFYSLDRESNITITGGRVNVSFIQPDAQGAFGENTTEYANLSMSFKPAEDMSVNLVSISLKRSGSGTPNSQLQIREDEAGIPSDIILASGNITNSTVSEENYSFINVTLNSTVGLEADAIYWLFLVPNSSAPDFYSWEASDDGLYANGEYSNNASLDLLFIIYDNYMFRTTLEGITKGEHTITVYANSTSEGPIDSPEINFTIDNTAPILNDVSYSPSTASELDPDIAINFSSNVTDNLAVEAVTIQYKKEGDSEFQNASTTNSGDIYDGSVTPGSEGIWIMRIVAWDTSNNTYTGDNLTFNITYEHTWSRYPASFNTTSALLSTNTTVGNIIISNTGDFVLSFNISKTSAMPAVYFNNTPDSIQVSVSPGASSQVSMEVTGQSLESQQAISILIDAFNASAEPDYDYTNFTFVSYVSGPYLDVEITEYDATVTQGQQRIALTARITNVGNETANNIYAYWNLPTGWTAKTNLTANYSSLGIGQQEVFTRYINLESDAPAGDYDITVYVNCSEGKSDSNYRNVNVNSSEEQTETPVVKHSGGGGGGIATLQKNTRLNITLQQEIEVERGANQSIGGFLENTGDTDLKNISIMLDGFPLTHYKITPDVLDQLEANATKSFSLLLNIPEYFGSEKHEVTVVVKALADNTWKEFSKTMIIIVVTEDKPSALICFENAAARINELYKKGIGITGLSAKLEEAKKDYDSNDYSLADNLCDQVQKDAELALKTKEQLDSINSAYAGLGKEVSELSELIKLSQEAFEREDYALASQRAGQAELLTQMKEKEVQQSLSYKTNIIKENWDRIIPVLVLIIIGGMFVHFSASLNAIKKRIRATEMRKENVKNKIKEVQEKYFVEKLISDKIYAREMEHYRSMLAEIENKKCELEIMRLKIISSGTLHDLEKVRLEVEAGKKELQRKYFVDKSVDKKTFKRLSLGLDKTLQKIDKKIMLKKGKTEKAK